MFIFCTPASRGYARFYRDLRNALKTSIFAGDRQGAPHGKCGGGIAARDQPPDCTSGALEDRGIMPLIGFPIKTGTPLRGGIPPLDGPGAYLTAGTLGHKPTGMSQLTNTKQRRTASTTVHGAPKRDGVSNIGRHGRKHVLLLLDWYAPDMHMGIAKYARGAGWFLDARGSRVHRWESGWNHDGVICLIGSDQRMREFVCSVGVPVVSIGYDMTLPTPRVATDNWLVAEMALEYFLGRGFRDIGYYFTGTGPCDVERMTFLRAAADRSKVRFHLLDVSAHRDAPMQSNVKYNALKKLLRGLPIPTAVLAENDDCAAELITATLDMGLKIPEEVAVLGVNNDVLRCEFAPVPISSIDENMAGVGFAAAELLDELFHGRAVKSPTLLLPPLRVVSRRSTDYMAIGDKVVADLLAQLRRRYAEPINADIAASWAPLCKRHLHALFKRETGRSVSDCITDLRLRRAEELLLGTDLKLSVIAERCGFSGEHQLIRAFRSHHGKTPTQYRRPAAIRGHAP